jgi:hypothetical protein
MSRDIKLIYNDAVDLLHGSRILFNQSSYINYSGDSQLMSSDFMNNMYELLMKIIEYSTKNTFIEPYSSGKVVLFNSYWWGLTQDQQTEINDYYKRGYGNQVEFLEWNLDDNGNFIQSFAPATRLNQSKNITYNGEIVDPTGSLDLLDFYKENQFKDRFRLSDFPEITSGAFYDPSLVKIESFSDVRAWFDAYDSILTVLKTAKKVSFGILTADYNIITGGTPLRPTSDRYEVVSTFSEFNWFDDETGQSGSVVQQYVEIDQRVSTGIINSQNTYVYSQNVTYKVDDGQGGFETINLTTQKDGITFNDSLTTIHDYAVSTYLDTFAYNNLNHFRENEVYNVLNNDYNGGELRQNGSGYFEKNDKTLSIISTINNLAGDFINYDNYTAKEYARWTDSSLFPSDLQSEIDTGLSETETNTRDGMPQSYELENYSGTITMISKDVEGQFDIELVRTLDKSPLIQRTEIVDLAPPV